ncbi:F-box/FBD/LRR-repeat protein At1g13570 [Ricinus communis]|uniref:Ubiquitin-protein ligase, putative n=1 Tax=Ricinus communis TaxID=3988 RepID=B9S7N1_RICCO|nr:F-box/FBD/LRR-repeat protein At1g13570 [Ricinus communis]XP_025013637.1 F-box/FBD/LRR-repeat protein At1g13570 [Ricinus communis]XP_025013638.1 F-box/FBD/LRR-repeat protein At1g13570 [Ricinus communis]XP_048235883.1 F-box/FBD/LRR-repeat protein At1g13570 [Ricinus communis]XP_048235884.1 F-box/FBD/LRR-repeat protein At1g13570 [Ricinus communis]EEF40404.1 ubiquitin-protein ligase, putative [Ricinus communis]|eukprot:XP_015576519.1 F-box/FBD/LRR-repeat protein At1g13570 [Ricinus communis]
MERIYVGSGLDRISDLPSNVIDHILACLPFKDAVRTSTLSKKWKEKWHMVPQIVVDKNFFHERSQRKLEGIINYILARHEGTIEKFSLSVEEVNNYYNLKLWIWWLSQKSIQELTLLIWDGRRNEMPSGLFSCQQLRKLNLRYFEVTPAHSFKGFRNLVSLQLDKVKIATALLERLIASCPLLERLRVRNLSYIDHLHINVPTLKYFSVDGEFKSICFNTPVLEVLSINLYEIGSGNNQFDLRFKLRGLPPAIKELYVRCQFQKFLAAGDAIFTEVSTSYSHLRTLGLGSFCFANMDQVSCLLSLIGSSHNLEILDITACNCKNEQVPEPVLEFWEEQHDFSLSLNHLRKATVRSFHGKDHEMRFVKSVLSNSPLLKEMTVECTRNPNFDEDEIRAELLFLCPASTEFTFIGGKYDSSSDLDESSPDSD